MQWRVFLVALGAQQLASVLGRLQGYGFHRDELYYLDCAHRLSLGYVDHSILTPMLALLSGGSLFGLSLLTGLLFAATVAMGARLTQEFGGDGWQQGFAGALLAGAPGIVAGGSLFGTVVVDQATSAWVLLAAVQLVRREGREPLGWMLACGLAGLAKPQGIVLVLALAVFVAVSLPAKRWLGVAGFGSGLLGLLPLVLWNAANGFPTLAFAQNIRADADPAPLVLAMAVLMIGIVGLAAIAFAVRREGGHWTLAMASFGILVFTLTGGKAYYAMPFAIPLLAWAAAATPRARGWALAAGAGAVAVCLVLWPVLPFAATAKLPEAMSGVSRERVGWESWVEQVRRHAEANGTTTVIAANYGQAGAIRLFAPGLHSLCGHNQHAFWPSRIREERAISVGYSEGFLRRFFREVVPLGEVRLEPDLGQEEHGAPVFRVSGLQAPADLVQGLRHFD